MRPILFVLAFAVGGCSRDTASETVSESRRQPHNPLDSAVASSYSDDAANSHGVSLGDPDALFEAARASAASGDRHKASDLLAQAARVAGFQPVSRVTLSVRAYMELGRVYPTVDLLTDALIKHPDAHDLRRTLIGILGESGRTDLMQKHYEAIIRSRRFDVPVLMLLTDTSQRLFDSKAVEVMIKRNPDDFRLKLGMAQSLRDQQRFGEAESVLREILQHHPEFAPALAMLGRMPGVANTSNSAFSDWYADASPRCKEQSEFWLAVGDRHHLSGRFVEAMVCYRLAAEISPNLPTAWIQIGRLLQEHAAIFGDERGLDERVSKQIIDESDAWVKGLFRVRKNLEHFGGRQESSQQAAMQVARALADMGRYWEAEAWGAVATTLPDDGDPNIEAFRNDVVARLKQDQRWSSPPDLSALDAFSRVNVRVFGQRATAKESSQSDASSVAFQLTNETATRGLVVHDKEYANIASSLIYSLGSGGAAVDYDLDGSFDLLFRSGGAFQDDSVALNSFLRNVDGQFCDVATQSACSQNGAGQGVAIGDYNEDGFPDIFLANLGPNRLLRNNGDGTYSDASSSLGEEVHQWTTCGSFVDLNRDSVNDLISVNYCDLNSDVRQPCRNDNGIVPCHPARFPADHDQILIGDTEGNFVASFAESVGGISRGRGLGIVAGSLSASQVAAFVANDMTTNHLLQISRNGVSDAAVLSGLAVDGRSRTQASMGIAAGDFDGDLDLDFYVTGFAREYNIFYEQRSPGIWVDTTSRRNLVEPTRLAVGFGAQAIDLDADGVDELAITNGHIGDFGPKQPPLEQAFQLMSRSNAAGSYFEVDMSTSDAYFGNKHIGRAMFKADVNGDLASDLVITHQNKPPVLLVNRTATEHCRIGFRLVGTNSSRDAIGAQVQFAADGKDRALWMLSGNGYMCSNERTLHAGVGACQQVDQVTVSWPSGNVEMFGSLSSGEVHLLIEGFGTPSTNQ